MSTSQDQSQENWERRLAAVWDRASAMRGEDLVEAVDALALARSPDDGLALFERACARDTAGFEAGAEHYYRAALLAQHLDPYRRSRAVIQLASTLRILGRLAESEQLLLDELERNQDADEEQRPLHDEARAILALTYVAQGRATEAAGLALCTLAPRLSRYNRSILASASSLVKKTWS
jgi:hypothetical protein